MGISRLSIPKDWQILELHMDSASASARGGHVIIKSGFALDACDNTLASLIGGVFPGRSNLIASRSDLANVNRAAKKGYGYRLMECGFISNLGDVQTFNSRMDELARGILDAFGIGCIQGIPPKAETKPAVNQTAVGQAVENSTDAGIKFTYAVLCS